IMVLRMQIMLRKSCHRTLNNSKITAGGPCIPHPLGWGGRPQFDLLDTAPYGSEKAFGALNAAAVSLNRMNVILGLYGDGVYLAVVGQNSQKLGLPNLADILYAYGELRVIVHEPSLVS